MRVLLIGTVESSRVALDALLRSGHTLVGVVTAPRTGLNAEWVDLAAPCAAAGIACLVSGDTRSAEVAEWVRAARPDLILCIGWSRLLGPELLGLPPRGCVGFHPAALPRNRGRHPLIWALVLGLDRTASTLFMMDEGADSGPIVSQRPITITVEDDARSLYDKVTACLPGQIDDALRKIEDGMPLEAQDHSRASYWRKRSAQDGRIDFRMSSQTIHNLVRALTRPYPGATVKWQGEDHIVWRCRPLAWGEPDIEPGRVLDIAGAEPLIKTADGAVALVEHEIAPLPARGNYL